MRLTFSMFVINYLVTQLKLLTSMHLHISLEILFEIASWLLFIVSQVSYISLYVLRTVTEQYSYTGTQIRNSSDFGKLLYASGISHRCLQISVHCCLVILHSQEARDNEASNTRAIIYFFIPTY